MRRFGVPTQQPPRVGSSALPLAQVLAGKCGPSPNLDIRSAPGPRLATILILH